MMQFICLVLLMIIFYLPIGFADDKPVVQYHYTDIASRNADKVKTLLQENPAYIEWDVQWQFTPKRRNFVWNPECDMRFITAQPHVNIFKHRLTFRPDDKSPVEQIWREYIRRVEIYEAAHLENIRAASTEVYNALHQMDRMPNCILLRKKAYALVEDISESYRKYSHTLQFTTYTGHMSMAGIEGMYRLKHSQAQPALSVSDVELMVYTSEDATQ